MLAHAPRRIEVVFDDTVHVGHANAVVENTTQRSVLAGNPTAHGHVLILSLPSGLRDGDYTVRWSIVSDDGHPERGVLAFGVGAGRAPPTPVLGAGGSSSWGNAALRWLYFLGLLVAGGGAVFGLLARPILGDGLRPRLSRLLFVALLAAFVGGSGLLHGAAAGTRFKLVLTAALLFAIAGGVAAALAPIYPRLLVPAGAASVLLLAAPTLAGHALDADQPRWLSVPTDFAHVAAAGVWLGGLASLVLVLPHVTSDSAKRRAVAGRFSTVALAAVCVIAASGVARALTELGSVSQLWSTSYGRALLVKSSLLLPVLGLGWLNRTRLLGAFAELRRSAIVESALLVGVIAAVGVLTEVRPGVVRASLPAPVVAPRPARLPARSAVVDAHRIGSMVVAVARTPGRVTITLLGADNMGVDGRDVRIDGHPARSCGSGCYAARAGPGPLVASVDGAPTAFDIPAAAPDASATLKALTRRFRASSSIVFDESLSAGSGPGLHTRFTVVAPNRLAYQIRNGAAAVVIGARRWDKTARNEPWIESPQTPLDVTKPLWSGATNVHKVAPGVLTFLDRSLPAWFRVELGPRLPRVVHMDAAAHFMVERYVAFDAPVEVSPPSR